METNEHRPLTLGSLFDGIGGFPLAGKKAGIMSVWASEIEPFCARVTEKRLPEMRHYGDIHSLNGASLEPVDIITFGSPCQDLSVAGRREGLHGERSSLFYEAIRIIHEMRCATHGKYPRWAVWENVPGALSSHGGEDFRQVLQSLIRLREPEADVPLPENGKWLPAGEILADHCSIAWRVLDAAQGWGVPQRRKRIFVVLDLDGSCAGKVLFESEGMSGYSPPSGEARQGAAGHSENCAGAPGDLVLNDQGGARMNVTVGSTHTLRADMKGHAPCIVEASGFCTEHSADSRSIGFQKEESPTLRVGTVPGVAIEFNPTDSRIKLRQDGQCQTLCSRMGTGGNNVPLTLAPQHPTVRAYGIGSTHSRGMLSENPHVGFYEANSSRTLDTSGSNPICNQGGITVVEQRLPSYCMTCGCYTQVDEECASPIMARDYKDPPLVGKETAESVCPSYTEYVVRRLTPGECCRLQGYPDGWCENLGTPQPTEEEIERWTAVFEEWRQAMGSGKRQRTRKQIIQWLEDPHTDSAEYKAYGNSVAVPCVFFILAGIVWAHETEECL